MNRRQMIVLSATAVASSSSLPRQIPASNYSTDSTEVTLDNLLLKDYHPESIFNVPQTRIEKAKYPVIDFHNNIGETAPATPERIDEFVKTMDSLGVEKVVITGEVHPTPEDFSRLRRNFSKHPGRFDFFCTFDLSAANEPEFARKAIKSLEGCYRLGAVGVGEIVDKGKGLQVPVGESFPGPQSEEIIHADSHLLGPNFVGAPHLDDDRMDPLLERCRQLGMPVHIHVADPIWTYLPTNGKNDGLPDAYNWKTQVVPGMWGYDELIQSLDRAAQKHPKTVFVAAHFANLGHDLPRLGQMLDRNPNLFANTSARFNEVATIPRQANEFFRKYPDRILYGTDHDYYDPVAERTTFRILETSDEHFYQPNFYRFLWPMYGLGLPDAVLAKVYRENALSVFRLARKNA